MTEDGGVRAQACAALPLGAVRPAGWLRDQLELQAAGLTGHLGEVWPDAGPDSGWLGGAGEAWERGPYYCDGLTALAHTLGDAGLRARAEGFVEWMLASQRADGFFGPAANDDWWPRMVACKVLTQHAEATGDRRVAGFLDRYFRHQLAALPGRPLRDWGQARAADNALSVLWLHERTGEPYLLDLARLLLDQGIDWSALLRAFPYRDPVARFDHRTHVVNVAMGLKYPGVRFRLTGDPGERDALEAGLRDLLRHHGQAHGLFSGDEWLAGTDPTRGLETCAVVEAMFSLEHLVATFGDPALADRLERAAFNALPACQSPDLWLHQYDQQANQVCCTLAKRAGWSNAEDANLFGLEPNFGCCTANLHQGWPKFAARLWARTRDGGLAAPVYGPCRATATVAGVAVRVEEDTAYPFADDVLVHIRPERPVRFPLHLRVPLWAEGAARAVAGGAEAPVGQGWAVIDREWRDGDTVVLRLPAPVRAVARPSGAVAVERGPLVFALPVREEWRRLRGVDPVADHEVHPAGPWNFGLVAAPGEAQAWDVVRRPVARQPFAPGDAPIAIRAPARRLPGWGMDGPSAAAPPDAGEAEAAADAGEPEPVELLPYGAARLRVTELPAFRG